MTNDQLQEIYKLARSAHAITDFEIKARALLSASKPAAAIDDGVYEQLSEPEIPDENSPEFQAACSMALKASEAGVGPCGIFMAGYRTLRGIAVDVGDPVRFKSTSCSQCGKELGPANSGASHCEDHS